MKKILIISGPTASGKTKLSLDIAKRLNADIVNFDSLLFYKELNIGTAKPTKDERQNIAHHLIDIVSAKTKLNAADFSKLAIPCINEIHSQNRPVVLVGGSGFYLRALVKGMYESTPTPGEVTKKSNELYSQEGITPFWEILEKHDPVTYSKLHINDHYRIRRAVEHFWTTSRPFSLAAEKKENQIGPAQKFNWEIRHCYLNIPKESHWPIIQKRTDKMLQAGLIDEVKNLLENGFSGNEAPLQSIGYKEVLSFLNKDINNQEELSERISISTRQLAKAQRTWFQKEDKTEFNPLIQYEDALDFLSSFL